MIFLPDTNVWIRFLNPGDNLVKERFLSADISQIFFCSVVKAELYFGAMKSGRKTQNLELLDSLFRNFSSFAFDDDAAENMEISVRIYQERGPRLAPMT